MVSPRRSLALFAEIVTSSPAQGGATVSPPGSPLLFAEDGMIDQVGAQVGQIDHRLDAERP
jgi:hypothetical protein